MRVIRFNAQKSTELIEQINKFLRENVVILAFETNPAIFYVGNKKEWYCFLWVKEGVSY
jgi:hypothetical protein